jgi:hypothetical protein
LTSNSYALALGNALEFIFESSTYRHPSIHDLAGPEFHYDVSARFVEVSINMLRITRAASSSARNAIRSSGTAIVAACGGALRTLAACRIHPAGNTGSPFT